MKIIFFLCFFIFNLTSYSQCSIFPDADFKNKSTSLDNTKNIEDNQVKIPAFTTTILDAKNESYLTNDSQLTDSLAINPIYYLRTAIKKLNVSQSINVDYFIFTKERITFAPIQKVMITKCHTIVSSAHLNIYRKGKVC